jgi:uncharacterized protein YggE
MKKFGIMFLGIMLMLLAAPFATAAENNVSKLVVQGDGQATATPDRTTIVLGVQTRDASAAVAAKENARLMNETINGLLAAGIAEDEIQTSRYSLGTEPQDEPLAGEEKPKTPVFLASNMVTVSLNNTEDVGLVLDAAVSPSRKKTRP